MAADDNGPKSGRSKPATIYALVDPRDGAVRYVGKAENVAQRLRLHLSEARKPTSQTHKSRWLRALMSADLRPIIRALEVPAGQSWVEAERRHIGEQKALGAVLLNLTEGGEGLPPAALTPEAIAKAAEARKNSPRWRQAVLEANARRRGNPISPEHRAALIRSHLGIPASEETKEKMSAARKGMPAHPNTIEGSRRAHAGKTQSPESNEKRRATMLAKKIEQSDRQRRNWEDHDYRARLIASMKARVAPSNETRQRLSIATSAAWEDPASRENRMAGLRAVYASPEWRESRREIATRLWSDPDFRARMKAAKNKE